MEMNILNGVFVSISEIVKLTFEIYVTKAFIVLGFIVTSEVDPSSFYMSK